MKIEISSVAVPAPGNRQAHVYSPVNTAIIDKDSLINENQARQAIAQHLAENGFDVSSLSK